jgi:site-specific recombinase XerD
MTVNAPDVTTKKGLRDRAMLAILLGCGLRRSEVAALTMKHIQQRDNRWCGPRRKARARANDPDADVGEGGHRYVSFREACVKAGNRSSQSAAK